MSEDDKPVVFVFALIMAICLSICATVLVVQARRQAQVRWMIEHGYEQGADIGDVYWHRAEGR